SFECTPPPTPSRQLLPQIFQVMNFEPPVDPAVAVLAARKGPDLPILLLIRRLGAGRASPDDRYLLPPRRRRLFRGDFRAYAWDRPRGHPRSSAGAHLRTDGRAPAFFPAIRQR